MKPILINNWQKGIAQSPLLGFQRIVNCDIGSSLGSLKVNRKTSKVSGTTITDRPNWMVRDPITTNDVFAIDASGDVYKSSSPWTTWTNINRVSVSATAADDLLTTSSNHGLAANDTVVFTGGGFPVIGITQDTIYHVIAAGLTATEFKVSTSQGGAAVDITGDYAGGKYKVQSTASGAANEDIGQGLAIFKDYLIVARTSAIDTYGPLSGTPVWNYNWQTIDTDDAWHPMIISKKDGKLYGGASRYIFSIEENSGQTFAPGTAATYTYTQQALTLPANYRVKCLSELGNNLMIGTWQGDLVQDLRTADIFPWDTTSPTYGDPIEIAENGVHALITIQNRLYIFAGITGAIYVSNGFSVSKLTQIPESVVSVMTDTAGGLYEFYPNSVMNFKGKIYFGVGNNVATVGVYSVDLQTGVLNVEHLISTGEDGSTSSATTQAVASLLPIGYIDFLIGWQDNTTYGVDKTSLKYTSYGAFAESQLYIVASAKNKEAITNVKWCLTKPLATGQGIRLKYRKDISTNPSNPSSWTTIKEYAYSDTETSTLKSVGAVSAYEDTVNAITIKDLTTVQFRVELTTPGSGDDTPDLIYVEFS